MKTPIALILLSFMAALPMQSFAQRADSTVYGYNSKKPCLPVRDISEEELAFTDGERIKYTVKYIWGGINTNVGDAEAILSEIDHDGEKAYHTKIYGKTRRFFDIFFKVRDFYEAKFYARNCRPIFFHRDIYEGGYVMTNHYYFNDKTYEIDARIQKMNRTPLDTVLPGRICTFDLLSLFYFARNLDFDNMETGTEQPISFAIDEEIFELYFRYLGKETKSIRGLGTFRTLKFAARVVAGEVFSGKEELMIWVTDDRNRVPILFESPILVGKVSGNLVEWDNLKFPLDSKIK